MRRRSGRAIEDVVQTVFGLIVYLGLSVAIGGAINKRLEILSSGSFGEIFIGAIVLAILGAGFVFVTLGLARFSDWRKSWAVCPHGKAGGKVRKLCELCAREQQIAEEAQSKQQALKERQQKIDLAASKLRNDEQSRLGKSLIPSIEELRNLTPQKFEDEVARMFERFGYSVQQTPYVNDFGRDAILKKNGQTLLVECKKYGEGNLSGRPDLQKFHSAMITDKATYGFFVTTGAFTKEAIEFAAKVQIELVDSAKLLEYMFKSKPASSNDDKYRSMCRQCGDIVYHHLRAPQSVSCQHGHQVAPSLDLENVLSGRGAAPTCRRCGAPMRLVHWKKKRFWGCTRYPNCRYTQSWIRAQ